MAPRRNSSIGLRKNVSLVVPLHEIANSSAGPHSGHPSSGSCAPPATAAHQHPSHQQAHHQPHHHPPHPPPPPPLNPLQPHYNQAQSPSAVPSPLRRPDLSAAPAPKRLRPASAKHLPPFISAVHDPIPRPVAAPSPATPALPATATQPVTATSTRLPHPPRIAVSPAFSNTHRASISTRHQYQADISPTESQSLLESAPLDTTHTHRPSLPAAHSTPPQTQRPLSVPTATKQPSPNSFLPSVAPPVTKSRTDPPRDPTPYSNLPHPSPGATSKASTLPDHTNTSSHPTRIDTPEPQQLPKPPPHATLLQVQPLLAQPVQAQPVQAQPSRVQPSQAQPSQAQPSQAQPSQAQPPQAQPSQAQPSQAQSLQAQPSQAQLSQVQLSQVQLSKTPPQSQPPPPQTKPIPQSPLAARLSELATTKQHLAPPKPQQHVTTSVDSNKHISPTKSVTRIETSEGALLAHLADPTEPVPTGVDVTSASDQVASSSDYPNRNATSLANRSPLPALSFVQPPPAPTTAEPPLSVLQNTIPPVSFEKVQDSSDMAITAVPKRRGRPPLSSPSPAPLAKVDPNSFPSEVVKIVNTKQTKSSKRRHTQSPDSPQNEQAPNTSSESLSGNNSGPAKKKRRTVTKSNTSKKESSSHPLLQHVLSCEPTDTTNDDLSKQALLKITASAKQKNVVWTKIKGHPYWPTQIVEMSEDLEAQPRFKTALRFRRKGEVTCVMYFGTCEIAFVNRGRSCLAWDEGLKKGNVLPTGLGGNQSAAKVTKPEFRRALLEVKAFCAPRSPRFPRGWWNEPDVLRLSADLIEKFTASTATPTVLTTSTTEVDKAKSSDKVSTTDLDPDSQDYERQKTKLAMRKVILEACERADAERIFWAKMRGFPHWPVQVLPRNMATEKYPELKLLPQSQSSDCVGDTLNTSSASSALPCMFFGTAEVALVHERNLAPFRAGMTRGYLTDSERQDFIIAIGEVWGYIQQPRIWPGGFHSRKTWWNYMEGESGSAAAAAAAATANGANGRILTPSMMATSSAGSSKGAGSSSDGENGAVFVYYLPQYEHIKKSVWAEGVEPPPRPKKADIPCCDCIAEQKVGASSGKSSAANANTNAAASPGEAKCEDAGCLNFASHILCSSSCPAGKACRNVVLHRRKSPRMRPFPTPDQRGWGMKVLEPVKNGQFITEYVGEIITRELLEKRLKTMDRNKNKEYYMMDLTNDLLVDAKFKGNLSRFINSSCEPNCQTQKWTDGATGQTHVGIFAIRDIEPGTELTYNYGFLDYGLLGKKGKRSFECKCGTASCCMLDPIEKKLLKDYIGKHIEVRWDDGWYPGVVEKYDLDKKRFRVQYDDGDCEDLVLGCPLADRDDGIRFRIVDKPQASGGKDAAADSNNGSSKSNESSDSKKRSKK